MNEHEHEHDDWLRAALRHAPDADIAPPATLRAAILAKARANTPRPRSLRARIEALIAALARPPVTAALASLAVCTVLVVLWNSGALDEGLDTRPQAPSPVAEPASLPVPAAESPPAAAAPASSAQAATDGAAPRNARKSSPPRRETAAAQQHAPPAAATSPSISSPSPAPTAAPAPAPAIAQAPAPAALPPPQADVEPRAPLRAESRARAPMQEADTAARRAADSSAPIASAWAPTSSPVAEAAFDPLQALRRRADAADGALQWTLDGHTQPHAHAEGQRAWLAALDAAAGRRWRRDDEPAAAGATTLRLQDGERLLAEFALGADRVRVVLPGRGAWVTVLDPGQAAQLRATAQRW